LIVPYICSIAQTLCGDLYGAIAGLWITVASRASPLVNDVTELAPPFGGWKESGIGREMDPRDWRPISNRSTFGSGSTARPNAGVAATSVDWA
jgi:hypothetical protein